MRACLPQMLAARSLFTRRMCAPLPSGRKKQGRAGACAKAGPSALPPRWGEVVPLFLWLFEQLLAVDPARRGPPGELLAGLETSDKSEHGGGEKCAPTEGRD